MIDFRYHIVSLISVFLALAIGVVLGAGPLRDAIGSQLNDQVTQLREEKNNLRDDLNIAEQDVTYRDEYLAELSDGLLADQLNGRRVGILILEPRDEAQIRTQIQGFNATITQAGGTVTQVVRLTTTWFDDSQAGARKAIADRLLPELGDWNGSSDSSVVLGRALAQSLTEYSEANAQELSSTAHILFRMLEDSGLVDSIERSGANADVLLLVTDRAWQSADEELETFLAYNAIQLATIEGHAGVAPTTIAAPVSGEHDLVVALAGDSRLRVSTVAGAFNYHGSVATALAMSQSLVLQFGDFGQGISAETPVPLPRNVSSNDQSDQNQSNSDQSTEPTADGAGNGQEEG